MRLLKRMRTWLQDEAASSKEAEYFFRGGLGCSRDGG